MSKIANAFTNKKALITFLTAGDPSLAKTEEYILAMANAGADLIEIGIPFSDPIAEGEVIQAANIRALSAGTTLPRIFDTVRSVRKKTDVPLVFLTYVNPLFKYGYEQFFTECRESGINGVIIPDLPFEERAEISDAASANGIDLITLIAPTSSERVAMLARAAKGFVYLVSSMGVTGVRNTIETDIPAIVSAIKKETDTPVAVGFGISTPEQARTIGASADGVIVGSAVVRIIEQHGTNAAQALEDYMRSLKAALV